MSATFTPGPWYAGGEFIYSRADAEAQKAAVAADRNCGATLCPLAKVMGRNNDEHVWNAQLIVAAPELFTAVDDWLTYLDGDGKDSATRETRLLGNLRAARDKAIGA